MMSTPYLEQEEICLYQGYLFSKAKKRRQRYIPFEYYDRFLQLVKNYGFKLFNNKKTKPHEIGFITEFDENGTRYHLIVSYKYLEGINTKYLFWVRLHQDAKLNGRHSIKVKGFKCPFCNEDVKGLYNYTIHFKKNPF